MKEAVKNVFSIIWKVILILGLLARVVMFQLSILDEFSNKDE